MQLLETIRLEIGGGGSEFLEARAKALKGLVELVRGNVESGETYIVVALFPLLSGLSFIFMVFKFEPVHFSSDIL